MNTTRVNFEHEVLEASKTRLVLVDFWAPWCGPCRALGPVLETLAGEYADRVKLVKVNSDEDSELAATYGVRSIPFVVALPPRHAAPPPLAAPPPRGPSTKPCPP